MSSELKDILSDLELGGEVIGGHDLDMGVEDGHIRHAAAEIGHIGQGDIERKIVHPIAVRVDGSGEHSKGVGVDEVEW